MPDYWTVKREVIEFLDAEAPGKKVEDNYLEPKDKPLFKAATKLDDLGLGGSAMTAALPRLNARMKARFKTAWTKNIGVISIKAVTDIGGLIKLVAARLRYGLPDKEPT
jgi:hypothetical protein